MSTYRDLIPYGPPRTRRRSMEAPKATINELGASLQHSQNTTLQNTNTQILEKKLSLLEFKIEILQLQAHDNDEKKIEYYQEKYQAIRKVLLSEYNLVDFVNIVEKEQDIDALNKLKVAVIEN